MSPKIEHSKILPTTKQTPAERSTSSIFIDYNRWQRTIDKPLKPNPGKNWLYCNCYGVMLSNERYLLVTQDSRAHFHWTKLTFIVTSLKHYINKFHSINWHYHIPYHYHLFYYLISLETNTNLLLLIYPFANNLILSCRLSEILMLKQSNLPIWIAYSLESPEKRHLVHSLSADYTIIHNLRYGWCAITMLQYKLHGSCALLSKFGSSSLTSGNFILFAPLP